MKNVYDIRYEKNLIYVLPQKTDIFTETESVRIHAQTAVVIYLYYADTLKDYYNYIDNIPSDIDMYIISSVECVLNEVRVHIEESMGKKADYILKENRGRDVSALLVDGRNIVGKYKYVCFLHDKKEHSEEEKADTQFWIENLWGNQIGSAEYIDGVLELFEHNENLGVLAPPEPIGEYFNTWYGYGWYKSYEITRNLAKELRLKTDIRSDKPPITFGTVLWFRVDALRRLFDVDWKYDDFDDEGLNKGSYLSYGLERIFAYVAQDAGYDTGNVMTAAYAGKQMTYLQYTTNRLMKEADLFFPINRLSDLKCYQKNKRKMLEFVKQNEDVWLYGIGKMGQFCLNLLWSENIVPKGFIESRENGVLQYGGVPVITVDKIRDLKDIAVIITAYDGKIQKEMEKNLKNRKCWNYIKMWER